MTITRKLGIVVAALVALVFAGTLYYFMPRAMKVSITNTEVQRQDRKDPADGNTRSRDVLFVYAVDSETGKPLAFRNEDNAWYLKFDSGDVAALASKLAKEDLDGAVLLKYYGLRIPLFSAYPNVLSLEQVADDYVYVPWVNMVVLVVLLILFVLAGVWVRRMFRGAKAKISKKPEAS